MGGAGSPGRRFWKWIVPGGRLRHRVHGPFLWGGAGAGLCPAPTPPTDEAHPRGCGAMDFAPFDKRGDRAVRPRPGYGEWASTYEDTVQDAMDLDLLDVVDVAWGGTVA